jgi:hypothetical protein
MPTQDYEILVKVGLANKPSEIPLPLYETAVLSGLKLKSTKYPST